VKNLLVVIGIPDIFRRIPFLGKARQGGYRRGLYFEPFESLRLATDDLVSVFPEKRNFL
jgi:hypothetical protein